MISRPYIRLSVDERLRNDFPIFVHSCASTYNQPHTSYSRGVSVHHLILPLEGKGIVKMDGKTHTISPGDILFYKADVPVEYYGKEENFITCFVTFLGSACKPIMDYYKFPNLLILKNDKIASNITELCQMAEKGIRDELLSSRIYSILNDIGLLISSEAPTRSFEKAISYIRRNYNRDLPISEIARHAGVSKSLLFRLFKAEVGSTPVDYINSMRIDWAKHYLETTPDLSVAEIGKSVGFSSPSYFIECFKRKEGITPLQFRKELQQK